MTSLMELTVIDTLGNVGPLKIELECEPTLCALGPAHVAVGVNNQVWFYRTDRDVPKEHLLVCQQDYPNNIEQVCLSEHWAAVYFSGRISLHTIEPNQHSESRTFPEVVDTDHPADITSLAMTDHFLIYGTRRGVLRYWYHAGGEDGDNCVVNEYRHTGGEGRGGEGSGIVRVWPNATGTRVVFTDEQMNTYLYNPVNDQVHKHHNDNIYQWQHTCQVAPAIMCTRARVRANFSACVRMCA
eukprot:jgi/Chlat1/7034/Chrsp56S06704